MNDSDSWWSRSWACDSFCPIRFWHIKLPVPACSGKLREAKHNQLPKAKYCTENPREPLSSTDDKSYVQIKENCISKKGLKLSTGMWKINVVKSDWEDMATRRRIRILAPFYALPKGLWKVFSWTIEHVIWNVTWGRYVVCLVVCLHILVNRAYTTMSIRARFRS